MNESDPINVRALDSRVRFNKELGDAVQSMRLALARVDRVHDLAASAAGRDWTPEHQREAAALSDEIESRLAAASDVLRGLQHARIDARFALAARESLNFASVLRAEIEEAVATLPALFESARSGPTETFQKLWRSPRARAASRLKAENFALTMAQSLQQASSPEYHLLQCQISSNEIALAYMALAAAAPAGPLDEARQRWREIRVHAQALGGAVRSAEAAAGALEDELEPHRAAMRAAADRFLEETRRSIGHERKIADAFGRLQSVADRRLDGVAPGGEERAIEAALQGLIDGRADCAAARTAAATELMRAIVTRTRSAR
jgi:hypothetical protein